MDGYTDPIRHPGHSGIVFVPLGTTAATCPPRSGRFGRRFGRRH